MSARKIVSAVSWLSLGNVMVRALALFTMPLLTRYLSPDAYGQAALAGTAISLASVFALAGIDMSYARHLFSDKVGSSSAVETFCWRWTLASATALALLVGLSWRALASRFGLPNALAGFVVAGVLLLPVMTMAQVRARLANRYARLSWVQFAAGCAAAATSVGMAILWRRDAWPLLSAMVVGYAVPVLLLGMPSWTRLTTPSGLDRANARRLMATGLAGVVTAPAYWAVSSSDRWFLAVSQNSTLVGIYSVGYAVGTVGAAVSTAITAAWLPELSRDESTTGADFGRHKVAMMQLLVALLMIVAVAVTAAGEDVIRILADPRFRGATVVVPWLAAAVFFYGCFHLGNALLILRGKLHWAGIAWVVVLLVSLGLNTWLIPRYDVRGAALTQAISFLLVMALTWSAVLRTDSLPMNWTRLSVGFALSALAAGIMHSPWASSPWRSLLLKLPAGTLFAAACLALVAPGKLSAGVRKLQGAT